MTTAWSVVDVDATARRRYMTCFSWVFGMLPRRRLWRACVRALCERNRTQSYLLRLYFLMHVRDMHVSNLAVLAEGVIEFQQRVQPTNPMVFAVSSASAAYDRGHAANPVSRARCSSCANLFAYDPDFHACV